ncbi:MAG: hypothetical protein DRI90_15510 [Deltaproteobacteria bacterium]|nr:MAG: hypothetical protein DRI90_15510 [Deltaproteobacteria bacterium]
MVSRCKALWLAAVLVASTGCSLELDPAPPLRTVVRYDLAEGVIPLPSDVLLDEETGHLDLPIEADMSEAEVAFRQFLNSGQAWSTTFTGKVEFSAPVDRASITAHTFQIWDFSGTPQRLEWEWDDQEHSPGFEGPDVVLSDDATKVTVDPPRAGWTPGGRYVMLARGYDGGIRDATGRPIGIDQSFYFLRQSSKLDTYQNNRAFPGATRAERLEVAEKLEEVRLKVAPFFDFFESSELAPSDRIGRAEVAALWSFTVTTEPELAMDRPSQRIPLPFDLLIDPDTGLVDLSPAIWDTELEAGAKRQLGALDGFGLSANLMFELTRAVDPATVTTANISLYKLGEPPVQVPIEHLKVMAEEGEAGCQQSPVDEGCKHLVVVVQDDQLPLEPRTAYALVVRDGLRAADGDWIRPMLIGHFMRTEHPLVVGGENQLESVPDDLAERLETTRAKVAGLLDHLGRGAVITAWPFTTMNADPGIEAAIATAETLGTPVEPENIKWQTLTAFNKDEAFESLFPGPLAQLVREVYGLRLNGVHRVIEGTIKTPYLLDPVTRRMREDGGHELQDVHFVMTIPETATDLQPVPMVIFAHAIVTDRRFLLTIAGELAQKGFGAIAIDLPFHGERITCVDASLVALPNFLSDELKDLFGFYDNLIMLPPCVSGDQASCSPTGECLDANGNPEPFNSFLMLDGKPAVMDMKPASGAAFLDVNDIPHISDHFVQALVDLGAVKHSLRHGDWQTASGFALRTDSFYFAGQSLGAIIGAVYVAVDPDTTRAVLNVPGADMVDLFTESIYFKPQFDDYFAREGIVIGSYEQERLLNVARWLIDSVDPQTLAFRWQSGGPPTLLQIDSGPPTGDIIIPNRTSRVLQRVSGLPMREYPSILHADLIVPLLGDAMLNDMAAFLAGEIDQ